MKKLEGGDTFVISLIFFFCHRVLRTFHISLKEYDATVKAELPGDVKK
jgi:hypothetical protein